MPPPYSFEATDVLPSSSSRHSGHLAVTGLDIRATTGPQWAELAAGFGRHGVLLIQSNPGCSPAEVEAFYSALHLALGLEPVR